MGIYCSTNKRQSSCITKKTIQMVILQFQTASVKLYLRPLTRVMRTSSKVALCRISGQHSTRQYLTDPETHGNNFKCVISEYVLPLPAKLLSGECHRSSLIISQHLFRQKPTPDIYLHMSSLGPNELNHGI